MVRRLIHRVLKLWRLWLKEYTLEFVDLILIPVVPVLIFEMILDFPLILVPELEVSLVIQNTPLFFSLSHHLHFFARNMQFTSRLGYLRGIYTLIQNPNLLLSIHFFFIFHVVCFVIRNLDLFLADCIDFFLQCLQIFLSILVHSHYAVIGDLFEGGLSDLVPFSHFFFFHFTSLTEI